MPQLAVETGLLRRLDAALLVGAAATGGAIWFGWEGAVLMTLVAARGWPARTLVVEWGAPVRALRLHQNSVSFRGPIFGGIRGGIRGTKGVQTVYRDELDPGEYARLRRELKRLAGAD